MSVTILECLQNAEANVGNIRAVGQIAVVFAQQQLHNAVVLLDKGYSIWDEVEPLLEQYGDVESVPEKQEAT